MHSPKLSQSVRQSYGRAARGNTVSEYFTEIVNRQALAVYEAMTQRKSKNGLPA